MINDTVRSKQSEKYRDLQFKISKVTPDSEGEAHIKVTHQEGAFHLVHTQFYMPSGPPLPLFACNTQWKCIGGLNPPTP